MAQPEAGLSEEQLATSLRLAAVFMPYAYQKSEQRYKAKDKANIDSARFVHYTSAAAAVGIIRSKRLWMRNASCMVDYGEVNHGYRMLRNLFSDLQLRSEFLASVDACTPGVALKAIELFDERWEHIRTNTFIASLSEHEDSEDFNGRLSMWRAFAPDSARVAIVISLPWFSGASIALKATFSPVAYLTSEQIADQLKLVTRNIKAESKFLESVGPSLVFGTIFAMLLSSAVCLKHEGFKEECEWRAFYNPLAVGSSTLMEDSIQVIDGIPQRVHMVPLDRTKAPILEGIDFARIFDRLIIGPTQYGLAMYDAFVEELRRAGIQDADKRVIISQIPLRT